MIYSIKMWRFLEEIFRMGGHTHHIGKTTSIADGEVAPQMRHVPTYFSSFNQSIN